MLEIKQDISKLYMNQKQSHNGNWETFWSEKQ